MNQTNWHLRFYIDWFCIDIILKQNKIVENAVAKCYDNNHNTLTVRCGESKMVFLDSSTMKSIALFHSRSGFTVKLICGIAFGSGSIACYLLKSIAIIL